MADPIRLMVRRLDRISSEYLPEVAKEVRKEITRQLDEDLAAGRNPYGVAWEPRKRDGGRALAGAREHVDVSVVRNVVVLRIQGRPYVLHHYGYARGAPQRMIIPVDSGLPRTYQRAVDRAVDKVSRRFGFA